MIYKLAILAYLIFYTGIALVVRTYVLYRNTGINPFKKMAKDGIQGINEKVLILGATLVPIISLFYLLSDDLYAYLVPISYLEIDWLKNFGVLIMTIGSVFAIIAQFQMGDSWRIGIDKSEKTELIRSGFYRFSRNPIYLGLLISFLGFFLIAPNALSFCCLVMAYPSVAIKIRLEEAYLIEKHGDDFRGFMQAVNRWI